MCYRPEQGARRRTFVSELGTMESEALVSYVTGQAETPRRRRTAACEKAREDPEWTSLPKGKFRREQGKGVAT